MPPLHLFNSLTRRIEPFTPLHPGEARVYSCGPTVYNYAHIGNLRAYVFSDTLGRLLSFAGYALTHVINITDVGHLTDDADAGADKLEMAAAKAASQGNAQSIWDIARHYTDAFRADVRALNIREPAHWPLATDYVPQMIDFAQSIAERHCYALPSGLYFDTASVADYGRLARAATEEGEGRIDAVAGKRNPADFAIWRTTPPGENRQMEWDSPWGRGAPGWHLECSVMSRALLGLPFDIHTGGIDHREIHHPNEIAQNQAIGGCGGLDWAEASGARLWMHNNFLIDRTGKMSKSSGGFLRLQSLIDEGVHPLAYRLMCLQAHYRSQLEFDWTNLAAALTRLKRMVIAAEKLPEASAETLGGALAYCDRAVAAMADDLNSPQALTALEDMLADKKLPDGAKRAALESFDALLGLGLSTLTRRDLRVRPTRAAISEAVIESLLVRRQEARAARDFATSDALRGELASHGVELMDGDPLGWDWRIELSKQP